MHVQSWIIMHRNVTVTWLSSLTLRYHASSLPRVRLWYASPSFTFCFGSILLCDWIMKLNKEVHQVWALFHHYSSCVTSCHYRKTLRPQTFNLWLVAYCFIDLVIGSVVTDRWGKVIDRQWVTDSDSLLTNMSRKLITQYHMEFTWKNHSIV